MSTIWTILLWLVTFSGVAAGLALVFGDFDPAGWALGILALGLWFMLVNWLGLKAVQAKLSEDEARYYDYH